MVKTKNSLIFIITMILFIFIVSQVYEHYYGILLNESATLTIDKSEFIDLDTNDNDISNRQLDPEESKLKIYEAIIPMEVFEKAFADQYELTPNWFIMIEKPDCQYLEIQINNNVVETIGKINGKSNLWNGTFVGKFSEDQIKDFNNITIIMYSDYMTGVGGDIHLLTADQYSKIEHLLKLNDVIMNSSIVMGFFSSFMLLLVIFAWHKQLYNLPAYIAFFISVLALSVSLFDYNTLDYIFIDYLLYKKIIIVSQHLAATSAGIAIAMLINARFKLNIGILGLLLSIILAVVANDMIEFRGYLSKISVFLIFAIIQTVIILVLHRKRAPAAAYSLLTAFMLAFFSVSKVIFLIFSNYDYPTIIDLSVLTILYSVSIMYIFYIELLSMVSGNVQEISDQHVTSYMQGSFDIDSNFQVIGGYSTSCNQIFNRHIMGLDIFELMPFSEEDIHFYRETLTSCFQEKYSFKDGFISLMPREVLVNERCYTLHYKFYRQSTRLAVTMTDITRTRELEHELSQERRKHKFVLNAITNIDELSFLYKKIMELMDQIKLKGKVKETRYDLHTIKGNLGQFGFVDFENVIHEIEEDYESLSKEDVYKYLEAGLNQSFDTLEKYISKDTLIHSIEQINVKKSDLIALEEAYYNKYSDDEIYNKIKEIRRVDLISLFERFESYTLNLASQYEKIIHPLVMEGDKIMVLYEHVEPLLETLIGIYRNIIVHGIENPEERIAAGKDPLGTIRTRLERGDNLRLVIEDDGLGLDQEAILQRAHLKKLKVDQRSNILEILLSEDFSTKDTVDLVAGRGIGLTAVKHYVESKNGTIKLESEKGLYTRFIIELPIEAFVD